VAFAHVLEVPGKRRLPTETSVVLHQTLYLGFRAPSAAIEIGAGVAILVTTILAFLAFGMGPAFWLTLAALIGTWVTTLIFFTVTDVSNRRYARADPHNPPSDWQQTRARWDASHAVRAALFLLSLGFLVGAMLAQ
jgi:hypothetical protein